MSSPVAALMAGFNPNMVWVGLKILYMVAFGLYVAFVLVVLVQIKEMVAALKTGFDASLKLIGWVHLMVAIGAFLLAFMLL